MQRGLRMDEEVPVRLDDGELLDRGASLAERIARRTAMVEAMKSEARRRKKEIEEVDAEIARLGRVISNAHEMRKQGDLKFGDTVATAALAEVAKRAERCTPVAATSCPLHGTCSCQDPERSSLDCTLHGPDSTHAKGDFAPFVALPTEPHTFVGDGDACTICGSNEPDPIHHVEPHAFVEDLVAPAECGFCRARLGHPIHVSEDEGGEVLCTITPDTVIPRVEDDPAIGGDQLEQEDEDDDLEEEEEEQEGDEVQA